MTERRLLSRPTGRGRRRWLFLRRVCPRFLLRRCGFLVFTREMVTHPAAVGAACPSSKFLARQMARCVPVRASGLVVELGAGTGAVTQAMLNCGIAPCQVIAIERSETLVNYLRQRFPGVHVIQGDAMDMVSLLGEDARHVYCVVSGLPLRSLPDETVNTIIGQIEHTLKPDDLFVQFTYRRRAHPLHGAPRLRLTATQDVWLNLPPARIEIYRAT